MNPILQALQTMGIMPKPQILSPLPSDASPGGYNDPATDPGLANYYQQQQIASQITPQQAQKTIASVQPKTIQYPSWMANAPGSPTLASVMGWNTTPSSQTSQTNAIKQALNILNPSVQQSQAQTVAPTPSQVPNINQGFINALNNQILPVTRQYGIPDALVAAQAAQESGYGQKPAAQNNWFGLKAHSYPGFANFPSIGDAARYYAQTVQSLAGGDLSKYKGNSMAILKAIQTGKQHYEGDNPNPLQYVYDVSNNPVWKAYGGGAAMATNPKGWAK